MGGTRGLIVGIENNEHLAQWTLAAKPNHPALAAVIAEVLRRSVESRCRQTVEPDTVHYCTGPAVFTDALLHFANATSIHELAAVAAAADIFVHAQIVLNGEAVHHAFASVSWRAPSYSSWRREIDMMLQLAEVNEAST